MTWQYKKVSSDATEKKLQEFLDASQYSKKGILKYEKVFGHRFVSTGGKQTTMEFCQLLHLQPGQKVLDVCCGIGGSAFHMAQVSQSSVVLSSLFDLSFHLPQYTVERNGLSYLIRSLVLRCTVWTCPPT